MLMLRSMGTSLGPGRAADQILRRSSVGRELKRGNVDMISSLSFWEREWKRDG